MERRDGDAIVATFAEGGSYSDPVVPVPLTGEAIGAYAKALWAAFPGLSFEMISVAKGERGLVAAEWRMSGTHSGGPFNGLPPSGRRASLSGADLIRVEGDKIRFVQGYFDTTVLFAALGTASPA